MLLQYLSCVRSSQFCKSVTKMFLVEIVPWIDINLKIRQKDGTEIIGFSMNDEILSVP